MYFGVNALGVLGLAIAVQVGIAAEQPNARNVPLTQPEMHARVEALYITSILRS